MGVSAHNPGRAGGERRRRAFTLVEAIAAMVVIGVLGSVSSSIIFTAARAATDASVSAQMQSDAATALDRIVRELRPVAENGASVGLGPAITSVTASSIAWDTGSSLSLSGTDVMLTLAGGTARVLLRDVTSLSVQTYDAANAALGAALSGTGCDPIRRVQVQVTVQRQGRTETARAKVFIRPLMAGS